MACAICLDYKVETLNIFGEEGTRLDISSIISLHFWFQPIRGDPTLGYICFPCWKQIDEFHSFYILVKEQHQHQQSSTNYFKSADYQGNDSYENYGHVDISGSERKNQGNKTTANDNKLAGNFPEISLLPIGRDSCKQEIDTSKCESVKTPPRSLLEGLKPFDDIQTSIAEKCEISHGTEIFSSILDSTISDSKWNQNADEIQLTESERVAILADRRDPVIRFFKSELEKTKAEDALIRKYIKLECELCGLTVQKFAELCRHYQIVHQLSGYARCCDRKLPSKAYILDHINKHLNPDSYRCKECNKSFSSQYAIKNHLALKHSDESLKILQCEQCPERFSSEFSLKQHSVQHMSIDQKQLHCGECTTMFSSLAAIRMHRNVYHQQTLGFICHVCGNVLPNKLIYSRHLKDHAMAMGQEAINDPVCPICGKVSASVKTLRHHIRYVHSSDRPHKCAVCGKCFKLRQKLREHEATHAVGTSTKCPYCPKMFKSRVHVYSHKYRMHKIEYDNERSALRLQNSMSIDEPFIKLEVFDAVEEGDESNLLESTADTSEGCSFISA